MLDAARMTPIINWVCHAYCLMTNHDHLVIETVEGNLSKGIWQLNGVYTERWSLEESTAKGAGLAVASYGPRAHWSLSGLACSRRGL